MNKLDLILIVSEKTGLSQEKARLVVNAIFDEIIASLSSGEDVKLPNFGTFTIATRAARKYRNPMTGSMLSASAVQSPKFRAANSLKGAMNQIKPTKDPGPN
ncbi:MAG: HU family DNA-binding protein [Gimesia sp.]|nr:HU family DNA-binding protein [Gimesia sp.]